MANLLLNPIIVHKGRTNTIRVRLGIDVSGDAITSQIRTESDLSSPLIANWNVTFETDGIDGVLLLTLDDAVTALIPYTTGYMDLKRVSNGEPISVFEESVPVTFREVVTL